MSDGGAGKALGDAIKDTAKGMTVDLAKDIFEQIMSGGTSPKDANDPSPESSPTQHQKIMFQAEKNARMAQIQKNIARIRKERENARKEIHEKEKERQQRMQEQLQAAKETQQEHGFAGKTGGLLKNITNIVARAGKGEQRGQKLTG